MTRETGRKGVTLEDAVAAVTSDAPPQGAVETAAARVWSHVGPQSAGLATGQAIRGCEDVRALMGAHRSGALPPARALLVEDHLHDCPACRAAFAGQRRLSVLPWRPAAASVAPHPPRRVARYVIAASVLLAAGLTAFVLRPGTGDARAASVQSVSGGLHLLAAHTPLAPGQELGEGEAVRTARDSRAVLRLRDGSLVEMSERSEVAVTADGDDTTIHLTRGRIIVQAAKRREGHLRVASGEATVLVTGTVFSVNRGLKGSRVSVIEGSVRVAGGEGEAVLAPGDQWATSAAVGRVPLQQEIAWSADADRLLALMGELKVLSARWQEQVRMPGLRYESRFLRILPEQAVVFASVPNYGEALSDAHRLFEERLQESATLREFWAKADPVRHGGPSLPSVIERVRAVADHLGDEVVMAVIDEGTDRVGVPLVMAQVLRPGLRELLEGVGTDGPKVRFLGDPAAGAAKQADLFVLLRPDLVVLSPDEPALAAFAARLDAGTGGLDKTPFGERIAQAYGAGAGMLFAADLARITRGRVTGEDGENLRRAGLDALGSFVIERKTVGERAHGQAVLTFQGAPRGIVTWLGAPAPMGALDFVSPNAQAVTVFVVKKPALIFDDVIGMASANGDEAMESLRKLEAQLDVRLREDIAETLGSEAAFALDGALLPTPAWRVIVEVYDPSRLQSSLQTLVRRLNDELRQTNEMPPLVLEAEDVSGQTYHVLRGGELPFEIHYTFAEGYLVAGPQRALVMKSLQTRASEQTLARSTTFRDLFPPDREMNVSALLYQNLAPIMGSLLSAPGLSAEQRRSFEDLARTDRPTLVTAYGQEGAIRVAGEGGLMDLDVSHLALPLIMERVLQGTTGRTTSGTARRATP